MRLSPYIYMIKAALELYYSSGRISFGIIIVRQQICKYQEDLLKNVSEKSAKLAE